MEEREDEVPQVRPGSDAEVDADGAGSPAAPPATKPNRLRLWAQAVRDIPWKRVLILGSIGLAIAAILIIAIINFVPVGWARLIGDFTQQDVSRAILIGLIVGLCFTLLPLMVLLLLAYRSPAWVKIAIVVIALVFATPNLLTLWIQTGSSGPIHAADRIMDTEAFAFSGASIWGAVIGALAWLVWLWLFVSHRLTKKKLKHERAVARAATAEG